MPPTGRRLPWELLLLTLLLLGSAVHQARSSPCTEACDAAVQPNGVNRYFCGNDNQAYNATQDQFTSNDCYSRCGVAVLYAGPCGCPNDCGSSAGHGSCVENNGSRTCACNSGWGGPDCLAVACPQNACSHHGVCVPGSGDGVNDHCVCEPRYTGTYCGDAILSAIPQPVGVFPGAPPLFAEGYAYADGHPVFNVSVIATWDLTMAPDDYLHIIDPFVVYNNDAQHSRPATLTFDNGNVRAERRKVSIQVKGTSSRLDMKKGFTVKFDEPLTDVTQVGLKTGNDGGDTSDSPLKTFLIVTVGRALSVPMPRTGWALVTINRVFVGLYYYDESPSTAPFLDAFYGESSGVTAKLAYEQYLSYLGDNETVYANILIHQFINYTVPSIDTSNLSAYVALVRTMNRSDFDPGALWNVDSVLGTVAVEAVLLSGDNFADGNNFFLYQSASSPRRWHLIDHDFDEMFDGDGHQSDNIYTYLANYSSSPGAVRRNPIRTALADNPVFVELFTQMVRGLLSSALFSPINDSLALPQVYAEVGAWLYPWIELDLLQQLSFDATPAQYQLAVNATVARLIARAAVVSGQLLPAPMPNSPPATTDSIIVIGSAAAGGGLVLVIVVAVIGRRCFRARRARVAVAMPLEVDAANKEYYSADISVAM